MKRLLLTTLYSFSLVIAVAQTRDSTKTRPALNPNTQRNGYETYQSTSQIVGAGPYTMVNTIDQRYEGLRGTPYFLPEWNKGLIEMAAGQNYRDVSIKFDALRQQLILLRPWVGNDSIIVNTSQVKSFQLKSTDGQFYLFKHIPTAKTTDETLKEGYFMVLYQGQSSLLKRITKTLKQADYKNPYSNDVRYDELKTLSSYYVLKPDQTLTKVKLTKKALLDALKDKGDALKPIADKLDVKSEADAVALLTQYDSL